MKFDVNINATLEVDDDEWQHLLDCYLKYEGYSDQDFVDEGITAEEVADDILNAEAEALEELASDLDGTGLDSIYGSAWACSVDVTPM